MLGRRMFECLFIFKNSPRGIVPIYLLNQLEKNGECVAIKNTHNHTNLHQKAIQLLFRKPDQKLDCSICFFVFHNKYNDCCTIFVVHFSIFAMQLWTQQIYIFEKRNRNDRSKARKQHQQKLKTKTKNKLFGSNIIYANCRKIVQQTKQQIIVTMVLWMKCEHIWICSVHERVKVIQSILLYLLRVRFSFLLFLFQWLIDIMWMFNVSSLSSLESAYFQILQSK